MIVACVLRSGGEYDAEDVSRLRDGVLAHLPGARFVCLSDMDVACEPIPLVHSWPGWWSKMELFRPDIEDDLLYFDLDTIVTGDLSDMASIGRLTIMRDVYRQTGLQSSVMFIPKEERAAVWEAFTADPKGHMARCTVSHCWGDQGFLEGLWLDRAARWQDVLPGQVASYKAADMARRGVPAGCRAVIFHGRPKPRDIGWTL